MHSFSKSERLKSRKKLQQLFSEGKNIRTPCLRLIYLVEGGNAAVKCGVGVSAKYFKRAVDRNRIKRLLRESYRLQQYDLKKYIESTVHQLSLFILYTGKDLPDYNLLYENVGLALQKLSVALHAISAENT